MAVAKLEKRIHNSNCNDITYRFNASYNPFMSSYVYCEYVDSAGIKRTMTSRPCFSCAEALAKINGMRTKLISRGASFIDAIITNDRPY